MTDNECQRVFIPHVEHERVTFDVLADVGAMLKVLRGEKTTLHAGQVRRAKDVLRRLFRLPPGADFSQLVDQPQIGAALEFIFARKDRRDRGALRTARSLCYLTPATGELISLSDRMQQVYLAEKSNATTVWRRIRADVVLHHIVHADGTPASDADLPSRPSVIRYLHAWQRENAFVRRAHTRKTDWDAHEAPYVTRDIESLAPGDLWMGDHTELDFDVYNERGSIDRRWISAMIDARTGVLVGYHLSWQPNSTTIALAFRNATLSAQLNVQTSAGMQPVRLVTIPKDLLIDNGRDYRSHYTERVFGKIDFEDDARRAINRLGVGIETHHATKYHGQSKAQQERFFGVIQNILKMLPGYKSNNARLRAPDIYKSERRRGLLLSFDDFDRVFAAAIDTYNNRAHRNHGDRSPIETYLTYTTEQRTIDERVLDFLLMKVENRVVRRGQVTINNIPYYSDALVDVNNTHATVYYDPRDMGLASVYVKGKFAGVALNKELLGKDEHAALAIVHDRKRHEREMWEQIRVQRRGLSEDEINAELLEAELMDRKSVSLELYSKITPTLMRLTGLETEAKRVAEASAVAKAEVQQERESKRKRKHTPLTLAAVNKLE